MDSLETKSQSSQENILNSILNVWNTGFILSDVTFFEHREVLFILSIQAIGYSD